MGLGKVAQTLGEGRTDRGCVLHEAFVTDHVQDGKAHRSGHRIAAERVEIARLRAEIGQNFGLQDQTRHRVAIAHRLAQADHVGDKTMALKAPHLAASPAKARLHLIGNEKATLGANRGGCRGKEACRIGADPIRGEDRVDDQRTGFDALRVHPVTGGGDSGGKACGDAFGVILDRRRGDGEYRRPRRDGGAHRHRHLGSGKGHAMIGVVGNDHPAAPGCRACDPQGQVVRLASGAGEHHMTKLRREQGQQAFGIVKDAVMQIAGMRGQHPRLCGHGGDHAGVAMADRSDVVVGVKIGAAITVVKPDAVAPDDVQGFGIEQPVSRTKQARPAGDPGLILGGQGGSTGNKGIGHQGRAGHGLGLSQAVRRASANRAGSALRRTRRPVSAEGALRRI